MPAPAGIDQRNPVHPSSNMRMRTLFRDVSYALRSIRSARVFAATAVLTLALGIGGTTAIFTLMHAVMLKSLPVADPSRLYRIGDGDNCCVQGSPQGRWGFYTFQLFERIKAETPQFQDITAFSTFVGRMSTRRQGVAEAPRPLRTMYATGSYFTTLGVTPFTGRLFTADDDRAAAPPVVVMAYHAWQGLYGGDASVVGSTLVIEGHPFTVAGIGPPGFFGETLRAEPPDLWLPLQHETMIVGAETSLLRQSLSSWLRVIGRLRADATTDGMEARLTTLLRQWIKTEAGYPANWMKEIERVLPEQMIAVVPAGGRVGVMKEQYGRSLRILLVGVRDGAPHRLRERRQPAARPRRGAARPDRRAAGSRRVAQTDRRRSTRGERPAGCGRRGGRARRRDGSRSTAALPRVRRRDDAADRHHAFTAGAGLCRWPGVADRCALWRRARVVCHADQSDRGAAGRGPHGGRRGVVHPHGAAGGAGRARGGARRRIDDARSQSGQPRRTGLRLRSQRSRARSRRPTVGGFRG